MKKITNTNEALELNGGKTYNCRFCKKHSGGYWNVYWHALNSGCFKKNKTLESLWDAGWGLISIGAKLGGFIK